MRALWSRRPSIIIRILGTGIVSGVLCLASWLFIQHQQHTLSELQKTQAQRIKQQERSLAKLKQDITTKKEAARKQAAQKIAEHTIAQKNTPTKEPTAPQRVKASDCNTSRTHDNPASIDVLVNKKHCIKPLTFVPDDLVVAEGVKVSKKIQPDLLRMLADAKKNGHMLRITSGYRSYATQVKTYNFWVKHSGGAEKADTYSARPGYSEHQTGLVVDLEIPGCALRCFTKTPAYLWLRDNAHAYGFIERYPVGKTDITGYIHESWHYRYVGTETAAAIKKSGGATLEEYWSLPGGSY